jgi:hypothetical protein
MMSLQMDVDIGSSSVARNIVGLVIGYVTGLVVDLAVLIQVSDSYTSRVVVLHIRGPSFLPSLRVLVNSRSHSLPAPRKWKKDLSLYLPTNVAGFLLSLVLPVVDRPILWLYFQEVGQSLLLPLFCLLNV